MIFRDFDYIFDGEQMKDIPEFYDQVSMILTEDLDFEPGHNLDAFADLLKGGFGKHSVGETFSVLWKNFDLSVQNLGQDFVLRAVRILLDNEAGHDCILKIER